MATRMTWEQWQLRKKHADDQAKRCVCCHRLLLPDDKVRDFSDHFTEEGLRQQREHGLPVYIFCWPCNTTCIPHGNGECHLPDPLPAIPKAPKARGDTQLTMLPTNPRHRRIKENGDSL